MYFTDTLYHICMHLCYIHFLIIKSNSSYILTTKSRRLFKIMAEKVP